VITVCRSLGEVLAGLEEAPDATLLAGGTDLMVGINAGVARVDDVLAIGRVAELGGWERTNGHVAVGANLTYREMLDPELSRLVPALAQAARTVGSPQIRNVGTLGGNLGTASPAGDTLPVLAALDADIELRDPNGVDRRVPVDEFLTGPKTNDRRPGEVVTKVTLPVLDGNQEFLKVGTRNAMVIAVVSVAVVLDRRRRAVRVAIGSAGPTPLRARDAEEWVSRRIDWERPPTGAATPDAKLMSEFGERVARSARPIDDHRSTADYRRHAVGVLARRGLARVLS
jgi:CO/xanthine dehydrogenase FAD-binding subunit